MRFHCINFQQKFILSALVVGSSENIVLEHATVDRSMFVQVCPEKSLFLSLKLSSDWNFHMKLSSPLLSSDVFFPKYITASKKLACSVLCSDLAASSTHTHTHTHIQVPHRFRMFECVLVSQKGTVSGERTHKSQFECENAVKNQTDCGPRTHFDIQTKNI